MRTALVLLIGSFIALLIYTATAVIGGYKYNNEIESYWRLADKSSTISKKIEGIDKYIAALENPILQGKHNAIFLTTPDNSFDANFEALKSLQQRLHDIEKMDVKSFEYQTAMQQLTGQEMGEANDMINTFKSIWWKEHHIMLWNWIGTTGILLFCLVFIVSGMWLLDN